MAESDPRHRRRPEWPSKDWDDEYDGVYREPQESPHPERKHTREPGEPGVRRDDPDRSREHAPEPNAR